MLLDMYVLVKVSGGVVHDVEVFSTEQAADAAFKAWTGYSEGEFYDFDRNPKDEQYDETKIFSVRVDTDNLEEMVEFADYIAEARKTYSSDDIEIDDCPIISEGDDGVWVNAWVWVRK